MLLYLTLPDRYTLIGLLPSTGSSATMREVKDAQSNLLPSLAEERELGIKASDKGIVWDATKDKHKAIEVSEFIYLECKSALMKLEADRKITIPHLSLWDQLVDGKIPDKVKTKGTNDGSHDGKQDQRPGKEGTQRTAPKLAPGAPKRAGHSPAPRRSGE